MKTRKGYMVISIKKLRKILKYAREDSKIYYDGKVMGKHNIVIDLRFSNEKYNSSDGKRQVNPISFFN